jgi:beta-glucosidase
MVDKDRSAEDNGAQVPAGDSQGAWKAVVESEGEDRELRIEELVSQMTLEDKIDQMHGDTTLWDMAVMLVRYNLRPYTSGENKRLGIPASKFTDGPRGVALNNSTCFPVAMARGATWDTALEEQVGSAMGIESRAQGANLFGGVCVNLPRHPGWGRSQETFGDDPYLLGEMGAATIRGLQKHLMACAKHFACNSIDESRFHLDVRIDERTLREVYLPHFRRCVKEGVATIMSAYNKVNGQYCAHNPHLLRDILKGDWGFQGYVISDWVFGTRDTVKAAKGGLDVEMPNAKHFGKRLRKAVLKGEVSQDIIDEAVTRVLRQKAGFAEIGDTSLYSKDKVACKDHTELALEVARKSIVLLKNDGGILPLDRDQISKLAVIGRLADLANLGDFGSSQVRPPYTISPLQGIKDRAGTSIEVSYESGKDFALARQAASAADAVIMVLGLAGKDEGEAMPGPIKVGGDREDLSLRQTDLELIEAISQETDNLVVVLEGGSSITMEGWEDKAQAILMAWYPGMEGGNAIADILFGEINPSGKLPIIFPENTGQLPHFDKKAKSIEYGYYHGYRLFDKEGLQPAFPFGFGLSYTRYGYDNLRLSDKEIGKGGLIEVTVDVSNQGEMAGDEIVQLYIGCSGSKVDRPPKELKGFTRVHLEPGETKSVSLKVKAEDLAYYDMDSDDWVIEEIEYTAYVGPSSRQEDLSLKDTFKIKG